MTARSTRRKTPRTCCANDPKKQGHVLCHWKEGMGCEVRPHYFHRMQNGDRHKWGNAPGVRASGEEHRAMRPCLLRALFELLNVTAICAAACASKGAQDARAAALCVEGPELWPVLTRACRALLVTDDGNAVLGSPRWPDALPQSDAQKKHVRFANHDEPHPRWWCETIVCLIAIVLHGGKAGLPDGDRLELMRPLGSLASATAVWLRERNPGDPLLPILVGGMPKAVGRACVPLALFAFTDGDGAMHVIEAVNSVACLAQTCAARGLGLE